jgi:hypothetical protein
MSPTPPADAARRSRRRGRAAPRARRVLPSVRRCARPRRRAGPDRLVRMLGDRCQRRHLWHDAPVRIPEREVAARLARHLIALLVHGSVVLPACTAASTCTTTWSRSPAIPGSIPLTSAVSATSTNASACCCSGGSAGGAPHCTASPASAETSPRRVSAETSAALSRRARW